MIKTIAYYLLFVDNCADEFCRNLGLRGDGNDYDRIYSTSLSGLEN